MKEYSIDPKSKKVVVSEKLRLEVSSGRTRQNWLPKKTLRSRLEQVREWLAFQERVVKTKGK